MGVGTACLLALLLTGCGECTSLERLQEIARSLSGRLWDTFRNATATTVASLEASLAGQVAEKVKGEDIAQQVADNISDTLATIKATLLKTAAVAENIYSIHRNQNCCSAACQYGTEYNASLCSMLCNGSSIQYISSGRQFGIETGQNGTQQCVMGVWEQDTCLAADGMGMEESAVHIPRDMHDEDPDVLCFVQWTDLLMQQFAANSLPLISTHYVGSNTRLLRFTPASDWSSLSQCHRCPLTLQDTFELGRRPWYTNTVSGDKYFLILLDVSGSMAGFQSILARTTISELLKALTPNDYFLVVQVGEGQRTRPLGCFSEKTRATPENVLVMNHALHSVPDTENEGRAQFSSPLQDALWLLGNSTECHRVLIVFTDGERETHLPTDLVRENNKDMEVQVFTFLVGYGRDRANLETVACQNRGQMGRIREYYDVIPAVLLITETLKLNQPPNSSDVHYTVYRDVHGDVALTIGRPVWIADQLNETRQAFGIVAFDIAHTHLLAAALQNHSIGASGYAFIVDTNGQLVNHPLISEEFIQDLSDDNLLSLDVGYYEHAVNQTEWRDVREAMLGGGRGQRSLLTWSTLEREVTYVLRNTTYSYTPIAGTPYVLVVVTPTDLWLVAPPTLSHGQPHVFTQFSWQGGRGQPYLQRVEGRGQASHLSAVAGVYGNGSTALIAPLQIMPHHTVGVVGVTLLPGVMDEILTAVLGDEGWGEEEGEVYLLDDSAAIVSAAPYDQTGWLPALYPDLQSGLVSVGVYLAGSIHGYELRALQNNESEQCESGEEEEEEEGEEEGECECDSLILYVTGVEVYQVTSERTVQGELDCGNGSLKYATAVVDNTTLTLIALSGPCLHGNKTECSQQPIKCVPCASHDHPRTAPPSTCHASSAPPPSLCASMKTCTPLSPLVVMATSILATIWAKTSL